MIRGLVKNRINQVLRKPMSATALRRGGSATCGLLEPALKGRGFARYAVVRGFSSAPERVEPFLLADIGEGIAEVSVILNTHSPSGSFHPVVSHRQSER